MLDYFVVGLLQKVVKTALKDRTESWLLPGLISVYHTHGSAGIQECVSNKQTKDKVDVLCKAFEIATMPLTFDEATPK